jgi:hypothetical protein
VLSQPNIRSEDQTSATDTLFSIPLDSLYPTQPQTIPSQHSPHPKNHTLTNTHTQKPTADYSADEADKETHTHLQREIEEAEKHGHDQGKPGGFLNKLIAHGNKKTEEQLAREAQSKDGVIR